MKLTEDGKVRQEAQDPASEVEIAIEKSFTKGPWSEAEDNLLIAYVAKHGDGNWNAVQKHSGLSRCGKSCRLRWVNHLRPDLKKGAFTDKEEKRVIELHALFGNKWARMAVELPGRTDNEIKNFWNTRVKRLQRLGLPIYPDEVREQAMNAATQSGLNTDSLNAHHRQDSMEADMVQAPELDFLHLPLNQCSSYYQSMINYVPTAAFFMRQQRQCLFQRNMYNLTTSPYMSTRKRPRDPEPSYPCAGGYGVIEQNPPLWNYPSLESIQEQVPGSHLLGNATYSSPPGPQEELPSFQCFKSEEEPGVQQHEFANTLVQSLPQTPSEGPSSSLYDGLLESAVYGSSGEKQATDTDPETSLIESFLLDQPMNTPPNENISDVGGFFESPSSNERHIPFDGDWVRVFLGDDEDACNNTK